MSHTGLKSLDEIAQTICLPNERAPVRLPTYPSIDKTATFRYRYQNTQSLRDEADPSDQNVLGRKRFLVTRDPAAPLLLDTVHTLQKAISGNPSIYTGSVLARTEPVNINTADELTTATVTLSKMYPWEFYNRLPSGEYDSKQWFVVPKTLDSYGRASGFLGHLGVALFVTDIAPQTQPIVTYKPGDPVSEIPVGALVLDYTLTIEIVDSTGVAGSMICDLDYTKTREAPGTYTGFFIIDPNAALVRIQSLSYTGPIKMKQSNGTLTVIPERNVYPTILLTEKGSHPPGATKTFRCLSYPATSVNPEYYNSVAPFRSTRLNASALLLTNVTKVLNKEGTVESSRVIFNPDSGRTFMNADVPTVSTSNPETRYFGALEKGAYTFTAPDQESLVFTTPYETVRVNDALIGHGGGSVPIFVPERLAERPVMNLNPRYMNAIILTDLDMTDDTQLALTLDTHWEFRTISTLYQLDYSRMPIETYHAAMLAVMRAGLFYENNTHQRILQAVGKGLKFAAPLIPGGNMLQLAHSAAKAVADSRGKKKTPTANSSKRTKDSKQTKGSMKQKGLK
ncbi:hypothetical protein [Wenzhou yanvirus-like virus 2]|uniref:hypothetical protein n=1 Tax=Wenzhou yanvirus-like virus 2 TaxID=1923684 RepID=UPI00090BF8F2|nr:hypothetical protein [Wenzhou yanvirus-like virus 2]APG78129.1 hypothetical protein [Wenzhou yanvirus-like virus 2]